MNYKVIPLAAEISREVRETLVSPQYKSLSAAVSLANGYGPCRSCLRVFDQGRENRIYFTYNSFEGSSSLPDPGPVFIHQTECDAYDRVSFPEELVNLPILFEAYGDESHLVSRQKMDTQRISHQISQILDEDLVRFINVRNAEAGCFIARVERI